MIEILQTGRFNSLQDLGRAGFRNIGVSGCGAMDAVALKVGNILINNEENAAAIEIQTFPFKIRFHQPMIFSLTGAIGKIELDKIRLSAWSASEAQAGQVLMVSPPAHGCRAYLCVRGGFDVPQVLGSRSTSFRGAFGGFKGRELQIGDQLHVTEMDGPVLFRRLVAPSPENCMRSIFPPMQNDTLCVRAMPASEEALFAGNEVSFWQQDWIITPHSDRTGYRLSGFPLKAKEHVEMRSYGVVAGIVQVPPSGEPIVQMSDTNTAGGYPKIAGVVSSDLWRLGQLRPRQKIRFLPCDYAQAATLERELQRYFISLKQMVSRLCAQSSGEPIHAD